MGAAVSILGDFENATLLCFVGANAIILIHLFSKGTDTYLANLEPDNNSKPSKTGADARLRLDTFLTLEPDNNSKPSKKCADARLRLDTFWTLALVITTAAVVRLVLPSDLANQIIAAWFVGQGFALQHHVQSYISGIKVRGNDAIWTAMYTTAEITFPNDTNTYRLIDQDVFAFTLRATNKDEYVYRMLSWSSVENLAITYRT